MEEEYNQIELKEMKIDIDKLMLNPNNPRLVIRSENRTDDEDIDDKDVQKNTMDKMSEKSFDIPTLMDSIKTKGFITIDNVFVRKLKHSSNYVVLEGNRRITAVKQLLINHGEKKKKDILSSMLLTTLKKIPCKELIGVAGTLEEDTNFILGIRHHGSVKPWGPIQQANSLYRIYMEKLAKEEDHEPSFKVGDFKYDSKIAKLSGSSYNVPGGGPRVKDLLRNYVVFIQMIEDGYNLRNDDYSFFEEGLSKPKLRDDFFRQDPNDFKLHEEGREKFNKLCFKPNAPINHSIKFREFSKIVIKGTSEDVDRVLENGEDPETVWSDVSARITKSSWLDSLKVAHAKLAEGFKIEEFEASVAEMGLIDKIQKILDKLKKIADREK